MPLVLPSRPHPSASEQQNIIPPVGLAPQRQKRTEQNTEEPRDRIPRRQTHHIRDPQRCQVCPVISQCPYNVLIGASAFLIYLPSLLRSPSRSTLQVFQTGWWQTLEADSRFNGNYGFNSTKFTRLQTMQPEAIGEENDDNTSFMWKGLSSSLVGVGRGTL